ncbi:cutinase transcription factor 1 alpha [Magnaporthiopsis poae ATCC 64411]|uniref:Cutinase transcription factor 1 alpha n=1 Tax=Magnaporthiopsis poae (strain ATCC 64411 / 73-15) TaxID=644358 RepID=A0A0C4DY94_MAGP6|nr:cutinase transcription factor 1 alpha [Magnaporthiopsis poae ATCC 64411]
MSSLEEQESSAAAAAAVPPQAPTGQAPGDAQSQTSQSPSAPSSSVNIPTNNPSHPSFRRQRASRACETCHARKVRCDAASLGVPCTNCVAFQIECRIPSPKRKKAQPAATQSQTQSRDSDSERERDAGDESPPGTSGPTAPNFTRPAAVFHTNEGTPNTVLSDVQNKEIETTQNNYLDMLMRPRFTRAPIKEAGRVAFLGESSNLMLLVHDRQGSDSDVVHYPLPDNVKGSRARLTELDNVEIDILHQRGAFLLPPRSLCDELIDSYFKWVHPIVPVINRTQFMRQYNDQKNPPSLLLLQAVLLAGSRVCTNPKLMDANGSAAPAALTFYKRAKALYDANYEDDRVTLVQALLLMGWYWEGPEDVTKNVFYWTRVATVVAQGSGMHRSVEGSQLSRADKKLWKRIWWTLFTRDRSVAVALGRPVHINLDDSDVEMLTEDDFVEDEPNRPSEYRPDERHVQFFLQYVKLCEIMGLVLSQQYSVASKGRQKNPIDLTHSDMALADWLQNCPKSVYWEMPRHHFWSALLHSNYYTTLCLLHRAHMPPSGYRNKFPEDSAYPSRNIAFQAAAMITSIIENLSAHDELRYCPAFIVYSLFSALIMHVYQMKSPVPTIQQVTQDRIRTCMGALKDVSRVWLVGKMVWTLFQSILGNKVLEERLQKAAGKRHKKAHQTFSQLEHHAAQQQQHHHQQQHQHQHQQQQQQQHHHQQQQQQQQQHHQYQPQSQSTGHNDSKRKYDEMAIDFNVNTPQPQESYVRSRPQTPSMSAAAKPEFGSNSHSHSHNNSNSNNTMPPPMTSPNPRQVDAFMGGTGSRPHTRPATPFNPSLSMPTTPPDLYLVTRNSPNLSQAIWENFQPDQLFPESAHLPMFAPQMSPAQPQQTLDPSLMAHFQQQVPQDSGAGIGGASISDQFGGQLDPSGVASNMNNNGKAGFTGTTSPLQTPMQPGSAFVQQSGAGGLPAGFWTQFDASPGQQQQPGQPLDGQSPDSWGSSSAQGSGGPAVPSTLNVEDWLQFFGINGSGGEAINIDFSSLV